MANETNQLYDDLADNLGTVLLSKKKLANPDTDTVKGEVTKIYTQSHKHRGMLVRFYIWYTILFTIFVLGLIGWQGYCRVIWRDSSFEIIPLWALNLLLVGMFGQFIGLLTIVTTRVWDYSTLFDHYQKTKTEMSDTPSDSANSNK